MRKYIDVEKIDFRIPCYHDEDGDDALVSLKAVKRCIAMTPSEDVVAVIRCKDCKYFREYSTKYLREVEKADGDCYNRSMNSDIEQFVACCRDDFCSYGERKENEK